MKQILIKKCILMFNQPWVFSTTIYLSIQWRGHYVNWDLVSGNLLARLKE